MRRFTSCIPLFLAASLSFSASAICANTPSPAEPKTANPSTQLPSPAQSKQQPAPVSAPAQPPAVSQPLSQSQAHSASKPLSQSTQAPAPKSAPVLVPAPAPFIRSLYTSDRALFPPELYPGLERYPHDELLLQGLAAKYPGRVVYDATPVCALPLGPAPRKPLSDAIPGGIQYIRCYANGDGDVLVPALTSDSRIIDLRYFSTGTASASACVRLCKKLVGVAPGFNTQGKYPLGDAEETARERAPSPTPKITVRSDTQPVAAATIPSVFVLVNHATSGPIEAMLDDLQERGKVILVGTSTAGRTAALEDLKGHPGWRVIVGEIQLAHPRAKRPNRSAELSIVGTGAQPQVFVQADPQTELLAWQRVESGETPDTLLRVTPFSSNGGDGNGKTSQPGKSSNGTVTKTAVSHASHSGAPDASLRRAHDILVALQIMGEIESPTLLAQPTPAPAATPAQPIPPAQSKPVLAP